MAPLGQMASAENRGSKPASGSDGEGGAGGGGSAAQADEGFRPPRQSIHTRIVELDPSTLREELGEGSATAFPPLDDGYEVLSLLGRGGMGEVLSAKDRRLRRVVALKVIRPEARRDPALEQRFFVEAQVGAQLEHPHIVPFYALERTGDGLPAFAMRLVEGETYAGLLERARDAPASARRPGQSFALERRLEPLLRVAEALHYAHARGVCHRDVKPENVMLGPYAEVYLMDWGIARVRGFDEPASGTRPAEVAHVDTVVAPSRVTQQGQIIGTVTYMAPEQAVGDLDAHGPATDQFAFGMMVQEAATLRPPRVGSNPIDTLSKAVAGDRVQPRRGVVPAPLAAIIDRATATAPEDRYPSVRALADDLGAFIRGEAVSVYRESGLRRLWRVLSARPVLSLSAFFAVVVALLGAVAASLVAQVRLDEERLALAERTAAVAARSHAIDTRLEQVRALVVGLATEVAVLAEHGVADPDAPRAVPQRAFLAGAGPPDTGNLDRYGQPVSFLRPMYAVPEDGSPEGLAPLVTRMAPLTDAFRDLLWKAAPDRPRAALGPARQARWLRANPSFVHVTYVGFENGLLLNYPGYGKLAPGYDARRRPWYVDNRDATVPRWGTPYPDASGSGILVPCNVAVAGPDGALLGVAGADLILGDLLALLDASDLPGWVGSTLLDGDGQVLVTTEEGEVNLGQGLHGNRAYDSVGDVPEALREAVRRGAASGRVPMPGGGEALFDALDAIGWVFVARFAG